MRFKIDNNLKAIAAFNGADPEAVATELCTRYSDALILEDDPENVYGFPFIESVGTAKAADVCQVLADYLHIDSVPSDIFEALCKLVVIGDGPCPFCGGELKYYETEGHEIKDGDYYTPNSWIIDNYVYHCQLCGETIKTHDEL